MKLPELPFLKKTQEKEYYLGLILRDDVCSAVIFDNERGQSKIVARNSEIPEKSLAELSSEELLNLLDKTISLAEAELPKGEVLEKTVFCLKDSWVEGGKIKKEYLPLLKNISDNLGLKPIGFLVFSESFSHLLEKEEGAPVSAIIADKEKDNLSVFLIRAGRLVESKSAKTEGELAPSLDSLLKHFQSSEIFPARIIVFSGNEDSREFAQSLSSHTWSTTLPFLHLPKVSPLSFEFSQKAVVFGASSQMGIEVADAGEIEKARKGEDKAPLMHEDFGFVKDADIKDTRKNDKKTEVEFTKEKAEDKKKPSRDIPSLSSLIPSFSFLKKLKIPNFPRISQFSRGNKFIFALPLVLLFLVLVFSYFYFLKATVVLTVGGRDFNEEREILFSANSETDFEEGIINAETVEITKEGSVEKNATGKKEEGENAKGTVTVFNSATSQQRLPQGTVITSSNNLEFTLDKEITVASATGNIFTGTKPGTTDVSVTASEIGQEGNLPSNTTFSVSGNSSLAARNEKAFEGGSRKEIIVVSRTDLNQLEEDLLEELEPEAKKEFETGEKDGKILLPLFLSSEISERNFSAELDDEAERVKLEGSVAYTGLAYPEDAFLEYALSLIGDEGNLEPLRSQIEEEILDPQEENDEEVRATVRINAKLLPKMDTESLRKEISGRSFSEAREILSKTPSFEGVEFELSPPIPFLPHFLPRRENNIEIVIDIDG